MCFLLTLIFIGPRAAIVFYWLLYPARWELAFETFLVGFLGFLFMPWTTMAYVLAAPQGVDGWDYLVMALGVAFDVAGWATGGGWGASQRSRSFSGSGTTGYRGV